jgi:sugar phosphate isomerase/epimerase
MARQFALAALTCMDLAPPELVSVAAAADYDGVGLRLIPVPGQTLPEFNLDELESRLADTDLAVMDIEVFRLAPETRITEFEPVMALAARLRATDILVHGADPEASRLVQSFGALCDLARQFGLSANIEPMPWVETSTVAKAKRIIHAAGRENGALLVDPIHFYRADNNLADLKGVAKRYLQFCDARPERPADVQELIRQARGDRLFPGEGGLDLGGLLAALPEDLPMSLEIPHAGVPEPFERARRALEGTKRFLACEPPRRTA